MSEVISCYSCLCKNELVAAAFSENPICSYNWGKSEEAHFVFLLKCISIFNTSSLSWFPVINPNRDVVCYWVNWGEMVSRAIFPLFLLHNRSVPLFGWIMHDQPFFWGWFVRLPSKYLSTVTLSVKFGQPALVINHVQRLNCTCTLRAHWLISTRVWRTGRVASSCNFLKSHWIDSGRKIVVGELQCLHWAFCFHFS